MKPITRDMGIDIYYSGQHYLVYDLAGIYGYKIDGGFVVSKRQHGIIASFKTPELAVKEALKLEARKEMGGKGKENHEIPLDIR